MSEMVQIWQQSPSRYFQYENIIKDLNFENHDGRRPPFLKKKLNTTKKLVPLSPNLNWSFVSTHRKQIAYRPTVK